MIIDRLFTQNDLLEAGMQASALRNDVILNNIANAETPGYKGKSVQFESMLKDEVDKAIKSGRVAMINLDINAIEPTIRVDNATSKYRLDKNNVDIDTEMVALYQNSVKYDMLSNSVINNYKRINMVLTSR